MRVCGALCFNLLWLTELLAPFLNQAFMTEDQPGKLIFLLARNLQKKAMFFSTETRNDRCSGMKKTGLMIFVIKLFKRQGELSSPFRLAELLEDGRVGNVPAKLSKRC